VSPLRRQSSILFPYVECSRSIGTYQASRDHSSGRSFIEIREYSGDGRASRLIDGRIKDLRVSFIRGKKTEGARLTEADPFRCSLSEKRRAKGFARGRVTSGRTRNGSRTARDVSLSLWNNHRVGSPKRRRTKQRNVRKFVSFPLVRFLSP